MEDASARRVEKCPCCGTGSAAPSRLFPSFEALAGGVRYTHPAYAVCLCPVCGLNYKSCSPSLEILDEYYSRLEFVSYDRDRLFPPDKKIISLLSGYRDRDILDFGCGAGRILSFFSDRNTCYGVEINEEAAKIASSKNIRIITEASLAKDPGDRFDAILLTDVYEHLYAPFNTLEMLGSKLKRGGRLIISTGNADLVKKKMLPGEWWYFRVFGHLQASSYAHTGWLAAKLSLRNLATYDLSHYDTPFFERARQKFYFAVYSRFKNKPRSVATKMVGLIPKMNRARNWEVAPSLTCTRDHSLIVFERP
ncbi:MAG TPA: class I SAM-dependent methyltransferase [Bacteroidia bacterium]|jgi:SAM-dependent methyltransferase